MAKAKKPEAPQAAHLTRRTPRPVGANIKTIGSKWPVAYLDIIGKESAALGLSRGQFLTMLVRRKRGELDFSRPIKTPYQATAKDLGSMKYYNFHVTTEMRDLIDESRLAMGNIGVVAYLTNLLNDWIGQPTGLKIIGTERR